MLFRKLFTPKVESLYNVLKDYENEGKRIVISSYYLNDKLEPKKQFIKIEVSIFEEWEWVSKDTKICSNTQKSITENANYLMNKHQILWKE